MAIDAIGDPPPEVPSRNSPSTFRDRMNAFLSWLVGFRIALNTLVTQINGAVGDFNTAVAGVFPATSTTSHAIPTVFPASRTPIIQPGLAYRPGMFVMIARTSAPTSTWMFGQVVSYDTVTGALAVSVTQAAGSGTFTDWTVSLSGPRGADGNVTAGKAFVLALISGD